jgi:hypothetical protein
VVKETKFLGFGFKYGRINIHDNSLHRFKYCVRALTNRNWGVAMSKQIRCLNRYLRGWRKPRTKVKNLLKRGVLLAPALSWGATRKGVWRSANIKGINRALSDIYLANAGLLSLKDIRTKSIVVNKPHCAEPH